MWPARGLRLGGGCAKVPLEDAEVLQVDGSVIVEVALSPTLRSAEIALEDAEVLKIDGDGAICVARRE